MTKASLISEFNAGIVSQIPQKVNPIPLLEFRRNEGKKLSTGEKADKRKNEDKKEGNSPQFVIYLNHQKN